MINVARRYLQWLNALEDRRWYVWVPVYGVNLVVFGIACFALGAALLFVAYPDHFHCEDPHQVSGLPVEHVYYLGQYWMPPKSEWDRICKEKFGPDAFHQPAIGHFH